LDQQWGDDWDDAPYEHNAGDPYDWVDSLKTPRYEIIRIYFNAPMLTPADKAWGGNSNYSVEQINAGQVAWLAPEHAPKEAKPIYAGVSIAEFKRLIWLSGGDIYELSLPIESAK